MLRLALRRIGSGLILAALLAGVCFFLFRFVPGDYLTEAAVDPTVSPDAVAALRRRPLPEFGKWLRSAMTGNWGESLVSRQPVVEILLPRLGRTLLLSMTSLAAAWTIAVCGACWRATRRVAWSVWAGGLLVGVLVVAPDLLIALAALWLAIETSWFETAGDFLLCSIALTLVLLPALARHSQSALAEASGQPFVQAARMAGIAERRIALFWMLPAAAPPLIALAGLGLSASLSASLIVETVLGWPGLGPLLLEAILGRDFPVILAAVVLTGAFVIAGNLVSELAQLAIDRRIRRFD